MLNIVMKHPTLRLSFRSQRPRLESFDQYLSRWEIPGPRGLFSRYIEGGISDAAFAGAITSRLL